MRILAVRGANLASLADAFEIDFEAEPLRSAGLFAITGETGAGKSTLLDALCLALYDAFPRIAAAGADEQVPDASGDALASRDPRSILRRGARRGHAEVDFVGRDGVRYRARWEVYRARDKAAGKLQTRQRSLKRAEAGDWVPVASGLTEVQAAVERASDLTFAQFRRTVLLAQGDFDAFLRADAGERADLLEKITGTGIYAALSRKAHAGCAAKRTAVELLEAERRAKGGLPDEDRAALAEERRALEGAKTETDRIVAQIGAAIGLAGEVARAEAAVAASETNVATAEQAASTEAAACEAARDRAAAAAEALDRAEDVFKGFAAAWNTAAGLDAEITTATEERVVAMAAADRAETAARIAATTLDTLDGDIVRAERTLAEAGAALEAIAAHAGLAARHDDLRQRLSERADAARKRSEATRASDSAAKALRDLARSLDVFAAADAADRTRREALDRRIAERREALEAARPAEVDAEEARLRSLSRALDGLMARAEEYARAEAEIVASRADLAAADEVLVAARARYAAARDRRNEAEARRAEVDRLGDLAEAAASASALAMRARLVDGTPCPVCGGTHHPFLHEGGAAAALVRGLKGRREALHAEIASADRDRGEAQTEGEAARRAADEASARIAHAEATRDAAAERYAADLPAFERFEPAPPATAVQAVDALAATGRALAVARDALDARARAVAALRADIDGLTRDRDDVASALEGRTAERMTAERERTEATARAAAAAARIEAAAAQIAALDARLAPDLAAAGITIADLDRAPSSVETRLAGLVAEHRTAEARAAEAERVLSETRAARPAAAAAAENAVADAAAKRTEAVRRETVLAAKTAERAALLGGEPTAAHRSRHNEMRRAAQAAMQSAQTAANEAAARAAVAIDRLDGARAARQNAIERTGAARAAFAAALAGLGLAAEMLEPRRGALAADAEAATRRLGEIDANLRADDAVRAAVAALDGRIAAAKADLEVWAAVDAAIGSANGAKFQRFAQSITLDHLVALANVHLGALTRRYLLERAADGAGADLGLQIVDCELGEERRSTRSLSGGERFLISLALALSLSTLEGRTVLVDTLFVDEGFGTLDAGTLDVAIDALEALQSQGRKVGVISHVAAMHERIPVQIRVDKRGGGRSTVAIVTAGAALSAGAGAAIAAAEE